MKLSCAIARKYSQSSCFSFIILRSVVDYFLRILVFP